MTPTVREVLSPALGRLVPQRAVASILATLAERDAVVGSLDVVSLHRVLEQISTGIKLFGGAPSPERLQVLRAELSGGKTPHPRRVAIPVMSDSDVIIVQSRCQEMCRGLFRATDCVRLATAASELARNIYMYAARGELTLTLTERPEGTTFEIVAVDRGPGIANLEQVMSGKYVSRTGLGRGLSGTKQLLDGLEIDTDPARGTTVRGWKKARL
jgi:serine/threonine-protein kinase RsbT